LFRKHLRYVPAAVHERMDLSNETVGRLDATIMHDTARSETEYRQKLDGYARLYAQQWHEAGRRVGAWRAPLHAGLYLLKCYLLRGGFLDGKCGLLYHRCHARYVYDKYRYLAELGR
jgi:(heptosyl)LPS beta-1,4-glucosyltransferase